jgi:hypothetical protein
VHPASAPLDELPLDEPDDDPLEELPLLEELLPEEPDDPLDDPELELLLELELLPELELLDDALAPELPDDPDELPELEPLDDPLDPPDDDPDELPELDPLLDPLLDEPDEPDEPLEPPLDVAPLEEPPLDEPELDVASPPPSSPSGVAFEELQPTSISAVPVTRKTRRMGASVSVRDARNARKQKPHRRRPVNGMRGTSVLPPKQRNAAGMRAKMGAAFARRTARGNRFLCRRKSGAASIGCPLDSAPAPHSCA